MKNLKKLFLFSLIIISSFIFFACGQPPKEIQEIQLTCTEAELFLGGSRYLDFDITPTDAKNYKILWKSSNTNVAVVNSQGLVSTKSYGTSTITAFVEGTDIQSQCIITVTDGRAYRLELNIDDMKKIYYSGEHLNLDGLIATAYFESGVTKTISVSELTLSHTGPLTKNTKIEVSYQKAKSSFNVEVESDIAKSIEITKSPTKTTYIIGESFDSTGMQVSLVYGSGKKEVIDGYTFPNTKFDYNTREITISYNTFTTTLPIKVTAKSVINDISLLQDLINNASDGDSIMLKEGTYTISQTITIPSSKNIMILGENENTFIKGNNVSIFAILENSHQGKISLINLGLSLASGENIDLISNPSNIQINLINVIM